MTMFLRYRASIEIEGSEPDAALRGAPIVDELIAGHAPEAWSSGRASAR